MANTEEARSPGAIPGPATRFRSLQIFRPTVLLNNTYNRRSMARTVEKNKALKLRQKGKSINEIAKILDIPKSTISVWCRDIQLAQ